MDWDKHKVSIADGKIKFRKRKVNHIPTSIVSAGGHFNGAAAYLLNHGFGNFTNPSEIKLENWLEYAKSLNVAGKGVGNAEIGDLYNDNLDDFDEDIDAGYVLPAATDSALGGVKQGSGITIAGDGTISAVATNMWTEIAGNHIYRSSGNVGIGTTSPQSELHIHSTNQDEGAFITLESDGGSGEVPSAGLIFKTNDGTPTNPTSAKDTYLASKIYSSWESGSGAWETSYIGFQTHHSGQELNDSMIIKGGNVGIGSASPGEKLDVVGNIKASGSIEGNTVKVSSLNSTSNHNKVLMINSSGEIDICNNVSSTGGGTTVSANPGSGGTELSTISIDGVNYNLPTNTNAIAGGDILLFHADATGANASGTLSNINIYTTFKYWTGETPTQSSTAKNSIFKGHNFITETPQTNSNGTYVSSLTIPKNTPTELEIIIQARVCGSGNGSSRLTITRNGSVVYKREKEATVGDCGLFIITFIYYDFKEGDVLTFQTNENNSLDIRDFEQTDYTSADNKRSGSITIKALNSVGKSVNNTTLVVANSKGIRVTHDKANIKAFTFPVDELTSWSDQRRPEGLTDDKGIYSYDGYNMYHTTYANSSSIFDANGDYIGWNGTV